MTTLSGTIEATPLWTVMPDGSFSRWPTTDTRARLRRALKGTGRRRREKGASFEKVNGYQNTSPSLVNQSRPWPKAARMRREALAENAWKTAVFKNWQFLRPRETTRRGTMWVRLWNVDGLLPECTWAGTRRDACPWNFCFLFF